MSISIDAGGRDERPAVWKIWVLALSIGVGVGAAGASVLIADLDQRHPTIPARSTLTQVTGAHHDAGAAAVTGTGPGLVQVADRSKAIGHATISGTGPDLVEVAMYGR